MFFKCKHPFNSLHVDKPETKKRNGEFWDIDYHLYCTKCGKSLSLKYAKFIGGVDEFLKAK